MDDETQRWVKATYYGKDKVEDFDGARFVHGRPASIAPGAWARFVGGAYPPDDHEQADHDALVDRILEADAALSWDEVLRGFVAGFGSWPRGRQTAISSAFARHLRPHAYVPAPDGTARCATCTLPAREEWDRTDAVFRCYWGYAWNEMLEHAVPDLEERVRRGATPDPTDEDCARLRSWLACIGDAPAAETPGQLQARLGKAKIVPGVDKYRRLGMLAALAELGVLPTRMGGRYDAMRSTGDFAAAQATVRGSPRSDVPLPLATWRGALGVDEARARALFDFAL